MRRNVTRLTLCAMLLALSYSASAQQAKKVYRVGYLAFRAPGSPRADTFRQGLRQLGYAEGKDIVIEWRYAEGKLDRLGELAAELVRLKVDVIVTAGPAPTRAAKGATATIPIVMTQDPDPVGNGFVASPCTTGRKHHRAVDSGPGDKRQATGAAEGDRS
jgi:putative ABC transport system substrate-binding protein